jgi:2-C-methyl-D-erythritol 4-phosphate cytidylyltransferase
MARFAVILPAAGKSTRFHHKLYKKQFIPLGDRAVWLHAAERFINRPDVVQTILVIDEEDHEYFNFKYASNIVFLGVQVVSGGKERADSVERALAEVKPEAELICVHDAARPCLAEEWIDAIFAAAEQTGAAIFALPISATLKRVGHDKTIAETVPREGLWEAQTPQVFRAELLRRAYAQRGSLAATDDAQLVERLGHKVTVVPGSPLNIKITTQQDVKLAEQILKVLPKPKLDRPAHPFEDDDMWK